MDHGGGEGEYDSPWRGQPRETEPRHSRTIFEKLLFVVFRARGALCAALIRCPRVYNLSGVRGCSGVFFLR